MKKSVSLIYFLRTEISLIQVDQKDQIQRYINETHNLHTKEAVPNKQQAEVRQKYSYILLYLANQTYQSLVLNTSIYFVVMNVKLAKISVLMSNVSKFQEEVIFLHLKFAMEQQQFQTEGRSFSRTLKKCLHKIVSRIRLDVTQSGMIN